ncbi:hypothetical protein EGX64_06205 [Staphylococcus epidermidis]|uniref:hypothetical protein n=1 Tax=Staphylococcus epidermidis TaxID=1282 RepID=UPI000F4E551B|nr:hypothetical protein [Staphylococcus epidermidis]AYY62105.1 hypothetical protein EGX64_06205 [Staphylococcus epidermidis]
MGLVGLIANIVMFLLWAYTMYRWIKAEKKVKRLDSKNTDLIDDRTHLQRKLAEMEDLQRKLYEMIYKDNKRNTGKYVVELKDEVYLVKKYINSYRDTYIITDNVFEALSYENLESAKEDAHIVGGRVLQHKPNLEVVE